MVNLLLVEKNQHVKSSSPFFQQLGNSELGFQYAESVKNLVEEENTLAVLSTHRGWAKPIVALLVNILIVVGALLTVGISLGVAYYATGSLFFQSKTMSLKMVEALGESAKKLDTMTNHPGPRF